MSKFKVGDLVRVTKPEYPLAYKDTPGWVDEMDIVIGREVRISGIPGEKWVEIMIAGDEWTFHSDWCELVTEKPKVEANTAKFKVGDKVRVTKPNKWEGKPSWPNDALDGGEFVVEGVTVLGYITVVGCNWYLSPSWCTLVETKEEEVPYSLLSDIPAMKYVDRQPKMRVYIAGKISGLCQSDVNRTFGEAAEKLRKWGFEPISPIEHGGENKTWAEYMLTLLPILHDCQGIYLLDNWDDSDGAKVEKLFAKKDGMFLIQEVK